MEELERPKTSCHSYEEKDKMADIDIRSTKNLQDNKTNRESNDAEKVKKKKKVRKKKTPDEECTGTETDAKETKKRKGIKKQKQRLPRSESDPTLMVRPEPEGRDAKTTSQFGVLDYDEIIFGNKPIFSDIEEDGIEIIFDEKQLPRQPRRLNTAVNSNTMIKYAIIGTELQNIYRTCLRRVNCIFID